MQSFKGTLLRRKVAVVAEPILDLDGPAGAPRLVPAPATSAIARERSPTTSGWRFVTAALALGALAGVAAWAFGTLGAEARAETLARPLTFGFASESLEIGRAVSATSTGLLVSAMAVAGRNLSRNALAGLFAAALVAMDPSILTFGRLALPLAPALALLAVALAGFTSHRPWMAWVGGTALLLAALLDPRAALWGPGLVLVTLLRGHIYASPQHLAIALIQAGAFPLAGALTHLFLEGSWAAIPACLAPGAWSQLILHASPQPGVNLLAQPGSVTWLVGLGALLFLGVGGILFGASRFRLARANGRIQARLVSPFPTAFGRGMWLLLLAATTLLPQAWLLLFALALALGLQDLAEDAPGFGFALAAALLLFAVLILIRSWEAITGTGGADGVQDALQLVPWAQPSVC